MLSEVAKHASKFNTREKVAVFASVYTICDESVAAYAMTRASKINEKVYMKSRPDNYDFIYVYKFLFKEYDIILP